MRCHVLSLVSVLMLALPIRSDAANPKAIEQYRKDVEPILSKYCFRCHADGVAKGKVSFDNFKSDDELVEKRDLWYAVLKNTRGNIMPPAGRPRPGTPSARGSLSSS